MKLEETRTTKRKQKVHHEILSAAAELICEKGSLGVSLEEIAKASDVARKTVYNHFDNKEALIDELVMPVCYHAMAYVNQIDELELVTLDHIWDYCLELWKNEDLNAKLLYQVDIEDYKKLNESKHGFIIVFMKLLNKVEAYNHLKDETLLLLAEVIYSTYMPLLEALCKVEAYEDLFRNGMNGLLKGVS